MARTSVFKVALVRWRDVRLVRGDGRERADENVIPGQFNSVTFLRRKDTCIKEKDEEEKERGNETIVGGNWGNVKMKKKGW